MARKAEKIAQRARLACEKWREYFHVNIDLYHIMHTFILGQQWTDEEQEEMVKTYRKKPMQSNKLGVMANQLMGEQQQNTPQLEVVPMTNCDENTAMLRDLILKDIIFSTDAKTATQIAAGQAFIGGFGALLADTDYTHQRSWDTDIIVRYFKDATRCYWDIGAEHINKTDGEHCGFYTRMTRQKFRNVYGKELEEKISKISSITQSKEEIALAVQPNEGEDPFNWADGEAITIMDHFERKYEKDMLYKLSNGKSYNQEELEDLIEQSMLINQQAHQVQNPYMSQDMEMLQGAEQEMETEAPQNVESVENAEEPDLDESMMTLWDDGEVVRIVEKREIKRHKIMHYKIAGDYILESSEFPSQQLPLIFVDQRSYYDKNGKQICCSFFGDAKDTQKYINYLRTQSAFILKVSRYDQFIGSKKNVQSLDTQRNWSDPNSIQGLLAYDESPNGHKPEQLHPPELSQSLHAQYQLAVDDLYTSTGLYPTRMGNQGNEVSGAAIDARTRQGSYTTFVAFNSINRAIAVLGEIINEMIPKVYDSERTISLMFPDKGQQNVTINKQSDEYGVLIENDIRKGTFQVRLKPGASYEGQKEEALNSLKQVLEASPQSFALIADLYAENLPLPNTIEIKNRLKTMVPPQILEAGKTGQMPQDNGQPSPEQMMLQQQQQAQQMEMQFKQKEIELKEQEIKLKEQEIIMEAQQKLQELENDRLEIAGKLKEQELRYMAETERTESDRAIAHADNLIKILTHNPKGLGETNGHRI